eukprot:TRINITY_DN22869_c0_g1_i1.p1 TRINITY_DN22869_c0_g1~~TRINITY_DN22869_c0_g1_i1.p1  ORF type:complete len:389 (+),score=51.35 TRINITY_DN22869_c0_g1_i1:49-1215(+)
MHRFDCTLLPAAAVGLSGGYLSRRIKLKQGRNIVGRSEVESGMNMNRKRVSRKQLILDWDGDRGVLRGCCGRQGRSTSYLLHPKKLRVVPGESEGMAEVVNGDKLTLNAGRTLCEVSITSTGSSSRLSNSSMPHSPISWECRTCSQLNDNCKHCTTCGSGRYPTVIVTPPAPEGSVYPQYDNQGSKIAAKVHFSQALTTIVKSVQDNPDADDPRVFFNNGARLIAYDAFPKSTIHLLGFVLDQKIGRVADLRAEHLPHIRKLHFLAKSVANHLKSTGPYGAYDFAMGYHCVPSLKPLHLHIITTDMQSDCLKSRKHYMSFCPPHFISADEVEARLTAHGKVTLTPTEAAGHPTTGPIPCRWCGTGMATIPMLKKHFETCEANPNPKMV